MDTNELKTDLQKFFDRLKAFEERARKLQNQNLADIAASARGRIKQLLDHPDTELLADTRKDPAVNPDGTPRTDQPAFGLGANATGRQLYESERGASADWVRLSQAERDQYEERARSMQKAGTGGPDSGKPDTYAPGDPRFAPRNPDFRNPNSVDLNPDGTLRQAPNSYGARPDVRQG